MTRSCDGRLSFGADFFQRSRLSPISILAGELTHLTIARRAMTIRLGSARSARFDGLTRAALTAAYSFERALSAHIF